MFKIRIAEELDFNPEVIDFLRSFAKVDVEGCEQDEVHSILHGYDVFWFRLGFRIGAKELGESPRCRVLATPVTGIDFIDEKACAARNVTIACLRGEREFLKKVRATAELTIALTFDLLRHTAQAQQDTEDGHWRRDLFRGEEIFEKKVGIVGYGRLGAITADFYEALGAYVSYTDIRDVNARPSHKFVESLEELIKDSDIVSVHVNYNEYTHHLLNDEIFRYFSGKQYLINTSRGGVISEKALLEALNRGMLKGAALDVVQNEHLFDATNPLTLYAKANKNLILTPHIGGNTYESFSKTEWFIAEKIKNILNV